MSNVPNIDSLPNNGGSVTYNLSLRDYFAAKAMQAMIANSGYCGREDLIADDAYDIADAMLDRRRES